MLSAKQLNQKILRYHPDADTLLVERAYVFARHAHEGQYRHSGEPYFIHAVATARHLTEMQLDATTVAAGLLHDVPEDTTIKIGELEALFGRDVAFLVEGVTKLSKVRLGAVDAPQHETDREVQDRLRREEGAAENLRKMFLAMAQDIRVVLIKLADRMHNMETLEAVPEHKRRRIALETLEIYAPLAERLGMGEVKGKLQDLAFPFVDPEGYAWINTYARTQYAETDRYLRKVMRLVDHLLEEHQLEASVHGRAKHLYSLYQKVRHREADLSKVYDLIAVRILVEDVPACYGVLGLLHQLWKPLPGRIKDYISLPKPNGYQSLHTTVFCLDGRIVEFQIRTHKMHQEAEYGIAAHWGYKEQVATGGSLAWVQQLATWQKDVSSSREFLDALKIDTFEHRIFVFTPRGEVKDLPAGASPLDFAYAIHTQIGEHCFGAKVNGKLCTLGESLQNGDVVEIQTSPKSFPKSGWLELVHTSGALHHIKKYLKTQQELIDVESRDVEASETPVVQALPKFRSRAKDELEQIVVGGGKGYLVRLAQCCHPKLGDSILGIVTIGKGVSVHQRWCKNVVNVGERGRLVPVSWSSATRKRTTLTVQAFDRNGLTRDIAALVSSHNVSIVRFNGSSQADQTVLYTLVLEASVTEDVHDVIEQLQQMPNVYAVERE
jgi:guanosine-3',5'-bis(diphosphate) 3'-pyrophosphohydrolase